MLRGLRDPQRLSVVTLLAVLVHLLSFGAVAAICGGIVLHVAPLTVVAVACLLTFAQVVPISIGGWGVREAASVSVFGLIGVAQGPALLASLLLGIAYAVASLPGALVWLVRGAGRARGRR